MESRSRSSSTDSTLRQADPIDQPDLTDTLRDKRIIGHGSFGTVYHCLCARSGEVAVKAITFPRFFDETKKVEFLRKVRRELGVWKMLDHHLNIVPLLGTAHGEDFGSDHRCMVSMWMPHGTLAEYVNQSETVLSLPSRIQLIRGSAAGLEYLHSKSIVHGDFHPGNILIDSDHNPRLTDFGFSQALNRQDYSSYLWTNSIRPGAAMWVAPELLYPELFPGLMFEATLRGDIYSLGSIILFILSGNFPWDKAEVEDKLRELRNPPRPEWPANIPDDVWSFIEQCWSPRFPRNRPSAQEVLSFSGDKLEQLLQPNPESDINVVLLGPLGCGKSSIINLLAEKPIAQVSMDVKPCTERPRWYQISIGERRFRLWDTMGFRLADGGDTSPLSPYEQAHAVLRSLPDGVHLILLCTRKDRITPSLGSLYWLINHFFYGGRAPIAFVVTHFDTPDEEWWKRNEDTITQKTGIPVQSIPRACVTTVQTGRDQSKQALKEFLHTTAVAPVFLRFDPSSRPTASLDLTAHCRLSPPEATVLLEKFSRPLRPINVVIFGEAGVGKSSVINLILGHPEAVIGSGIEACTLDSRSYKINTGMRQFLIWDTMGLNGVHASRDVHGRALEDAARLLRNLSGEGGVDLLVFCKKYGRLTPSELNSYRLFEEFFCEEQVPVAVVVTHLESQNPMEKWWEMHGEGLVKTIGKDVMGHACVTSIASDDPDDVKLNKKLLESRLSVQVMLEHCVSSCNTPVGVEGIPSKSPLNGSAPKKITVEELGNRYGLTKKQAKGLIRSYYGSG